MGREGNILERLGERGRALVFGVTIAARGRLPARRRRRAQVEEIASQVDHEPKEASVRVVGSEVEVVDSREGYKLDVAATMASVDGAIDDMSGQAELVGDVLRAGRHDRRGRDHSEEGPRGRLGAARVQRRGEELDALAGRYRLFAGRYDGRAERWR